jgi:hypothetical protein
MANDGKASGGTAALVTTGLGVTTTLSTFIWPTMPRPLAMGLFGVGAAMAVGGALLWLRQRRRGAQQVEAPSSPSPRGIPGIIITDARGSTFGSIESKDSGPTVIERPTDTKFGTIKHTQSGRRDDK